MHVCKTLTDTLNDHWAWCQNCRTLQDSRTRQDRAAQAVTSLCSRRPQCDEADLGPGCDPRLEAATGGSWHQTVRGGVAHHHPDKEQWCGLERHGRGWHAILTFHCNSDVSCKLCISIHKDRELYKVSPLPVCLLVPGPVILMRSLQTWS